MQLDCFYLSTYKRIVYSMKQKIPRSQSKRKIFYKLTRGGLSIRVLFIFPTNKTSRTQYLARAPTATGRNKTKQYTFSSGNGLADKYFKRPIPPHSFLASDRLNQDGYFGLRYGRSSFQLVLVFESHHTIGHVDKWGNFPERFRPGQQFPVFGKETSTRCATPFLEVNYRYREFFFSIRSPFFFFFLSF